jgi:hypothetical protein
MGPRARRPDRHPIASNPGAARAESRIRSLACCRRSTHSARVTVEPARPDQTEHDPSPFSASPIWRDRRGRTDGQPRRLGGSTEWALRECRKFLRFLPTRSPPQGGTSDVRSRSAREGSRRARPDSRMDRAASHAYQPSGRANLTPRLSPSGAPTPPPPTTARDRTPCRRQRSAERRSASTSRKVRTGARRIGGGAVRQHKTEHITNYNRKNKKQRTYILHNIERCPKPGKNIRCQPIDPIGRNYKSDTNPKPIALQITDLRFTRPSRMH